MGIRGGYHVLDFGGYNFTLGTGHKIDGIWEQVLAAGDKPCILSGLVAGSAYMPDVWVNLTNKVTTFDTDVAGLHISIATNDTVTVTAAPALVAPTAPTTNGTYVLTGTKNSSGFTYAWTSTT